MHSIECAFFPLCKTIELTKTVKKSIFILKCVQQHRNRCRSEETKCAAAGSASLAEYWKTL